jgi:hypothetical protein
MRASRYAHEDRQAHGQSDKPLSELREHWLKLGRCTRPVDRTAAADAVCALYGALGRQRPAVRFFSTPLMRVPAQ